MNQMNENTRRVLNKNNPYGFKVNINHPQVIKKWNAFQKYKNIGKYGMTDELRLEFEKIFLKSKYCRRLIKSEELKYGASYKYIYYGKDKVK